MAAETHTIAKSKNFTDIGTGSGNPSLSSVDDNCNPAPFFLIDMNKTLTELGLFIREQREVLGESQIDFAERCDIGEKTLRNIESGKHFSRNTIEKVLHELGYSVVNISFTIEPTVKKLPKK